MWFGDDTDNDSQREVNLAEEYAIPVREFKTGNHEIIDEILPLRRDLSTLVLGETGSGKTSTIELFEKQLNPRHDEPIVILDYKDDLDEKNFYDRGIDIVLSTDAATHYWNVFEELEERQDYEVVAKALAADISEKEFFQTAAEIVLRAALMYIDITEENPTNEDLLRFFEATEQNYAEKLASLFRDYKGQYSTEIVAGASALDPGSGRTGVNVFQTVANRIASTFVGDFRRDGEFSIKQYIDEPEGRSLVINMRSSASRGEAVYRLLVDMVLHESQNHPSKYVYVLLDEFNRLGELNQLDDFLSTIREKKGQAVLGVQSIADIEDVYGEKSAQALLENAPQKLLMRSSGRNVDYALNTIGKKQKTIEVTHPDEHDESGLDSIVKFPLLKRFPLVSGAAYLGRAIKETTSDPETQTEYRTYDPIPENQFSQLDDGEAVIVSPSGFARVQLYQWADLSPEDHRILGGFTGNGRHRARRLAATADDPHLADVDDLVDAMFEDDIEMVSQGVWGLINFIEREGTNPELTLDICGRDRDELSNRLVDIATADHPEYLQFNAIAVLDHYKPEMIDTIVRRIDELRELLVHTDDEDMQVQLTILIAGAYLLRKDELAHLEEEVKDAVIGYTTHHLPETRKLVAGYLNHMPEDEDTRTALSTLREDENQSVRMAAENPEAVF